MSSLWWWLVLNCSLMVAVGAAGDTNKVVGERCNLGPQGAWGFWQEVKADCSGPAGSQDSRCAAGQAHAPLFACCILSLPEPTVVASTETLMKAATRDFRIKKSFADDWGWDDETPEAVTVAPEAVRLAPEAVTVTPEAVTVAPEAVTETTTPILFSAAQALDVAKKKCVEYSEHALEVVTNEVPNPGYVHRVTRCPKDQPRIIGGASPADPGQFPHMVALGYDPPGGVFGVIEWRCAGNLISERFVLTAAHCTHYAHMGPVRWVLLGTTLLTDENAQLIRVAEAIDHPAYSEMNHYDDIALLKLATDPELSPDVRPACVAIDAHAEDVDVGTFGALYEVTGWGLNTTSGEGSEHLMTVDLYKVPLEKCVKTFITSKGKRMLKNGVLSDSMLCIGNKQPGKDSCLGDSGGPAQTKVVGNDTYCMYDIAGISSFGGNTCGGDVYKASIYTRVHHYLPWIVSVVWPEEATMTTT